MAASSARPVRAAEPPVDGGPAVVIFAIDPRMKDAQAMVDAVRAHLTGLPVRLAPEAPGLDLPPPGHLLGTLTIDPTSSSEWVVSFTEPAIDTTLVRHIRLKQGKVVALEEAAIVVRSMIEAILDGGHVGIAKPVIPPGGPGAAPTAPRAARFAATGGYAGSSFAPGLGWQSGALVGLRWQTGDFYAGATYGIFPLLAIETPVVSLSLVRHPGTMVFGYEGRQPVALIAELNLTADYVQRSGRGVRDNGLQGTPNEARWSFLAGAQVGVAWSFLPRLRVIGHGGIDWMINRYSYYVSGTGPDAGEVVTPTPVRPKFDLVLGVDIW